jgi:hypothetical protein
LGGSGGGGDDALDDGEGERGSADDSDAADESAPAEAGIVGAAALEPGFDQPVFVQEVKRDEDDVLVGDVDFGFDDLDEVGDRALAIGVLPDERGGPVQPAGGLAAFVVDE